MAGDPPPYGSTPLCCHYVQTYGPEKRPYKCPVCDGTGQVVPVSPSGTATTTGSVPCHACGGGGIVWGPPDFGPTVTTWTYRGQWPPEGTMR